MLKQFRRMFRRQEKAERSFKASGGGRLAMDWIVAPLSADAAMRGHLGAIRNRARDLERNNEWVRGFLRSLENNVLGEAGIQLQMRVQEADGRFDELANDRIEMAWWQWGRPGRCDLSGRYSWGDLQRLALRCLARDGEVLVRMVRRRDGLRLQVVEADLLDVDDNRLEANGNEVRFGVELDPDRRPVAYHLLGRHPGDLDFQNVASRARIRVPADEIIHLFRPERPDQTRGLPWLVASMQRLKMLDGYAEAELVAARTGAAKMGFLTKQTPDGWTGEIDGDGNLSMDASPGTIEELPPGVSFQSWDTNHPNSGYGDFVKNCLRGVATSLGISYNTLASDLEGVNYSSIRAGLLEEREVWKAVQRFMIEHLCELVFEEWLAIELLSGRLGLPFEKMWKFNAPEFRGRRWPWVDPKKDIEASILAVAHRHRSLRDVIAENGGDIYDVLRAAKADEELAASLGLSLTPSPTPSAGQAPPPREEDEEIDT
jgi:lambda family phage portal protein